jgi:hypothetical protein
MERLPAEDPEIRDDAVTERNFNERICLPRADESFALHDLWRPVCLDRRAQIVVR